MDSITVLGGIGIAAVIVGLVEALARAGFNKQRFGALVAIVLGVVICEALQASGNLAAAPDPVAAAFIGIVEGLSASGLYSGARALVSGATT